MERKRRGHGAICSSRAKQQARVHVRPFLVSFPAVRGPGGGEHRGVTCADVPGQAPEGCISSASLGGDDCLLRQPAAVLCTGSRPLLLRLRWLRSKCVLQKAFHFISGLNAIHLMNLAVQETLRIETHIQILHQKRKRALEVYQSI